MVAVLQTDDLPQDVSGAEALLMTHLEHKAEIDAREASFSAFMSQGEALVAAGHYASKEVCTIVYLHMYNTYHIIMYMCTFVCTYVYTVYNTLQYTSIHIMCAFVYMYV